MPDTTVPNDPSKKSQAEGDRWGSDSETVERQNPTASDKGGGISNRPVGEEAENQASVPERGESREGAHAGHGDRSQEENR